MCAAVAVVVLLTIVLMLTVGSAGGHQCKKSEPFYTEFAQEQPTREWAPYTGTIGYGTWGDRPWAEMASPHDRPDYLDWTRGLP
jgi:hypothetical protein